MSVILNIGLDFEYKGQHYRNTPERVRKAIKNAKVKILESKVKNSKTEPTLVAILDRALSKNEAYDLAVELDQEAIAQLDGNKGDLYGPQADKWKPFNPDYFLTL